MLARSIAVDGQPNRPAAVIDVAHNAVIKTSKLPVDWIEPGIVIAALNTCATTADEL